MLTQQEQMMVDNEEKKRFAQRLLLEFKCKNLSEGINAHQALWLHHKTKNLQVNFGEHSFDVDVLNMAVAGDIEAACVALMNCTPDPMTENYHWLSQERVNWLVDKIKDYLGW